MKHICLKMSYNGFKYQGFQRQPSKQTVQDELEEALLRVTGERVKTNGSGRTDAGVHARSQYVDFFVHGGIPLDRWCLALNSCLPDDIIVISAFEVSEDFHARRSAVAKTYKYTVNFGRLYDVFCKHVQYHFPRNINVEAMKSAAKLLIGEHDFTSFAASSNIRRTNVRTIKQLDILSRYDDKNGTDNVIDFYVTGTGFLQHMVRIIIGTLLDVGIGKKSSHDIQHILLAKNRLLAGPTAPSHGLILWDVIYPQKYGLNSETLET